MRIYQRDYFGFIYLWFDRKRKMFYIGSHMGSVDDGYICSSRNMKKAYKIRPQDFKRRIIEWLPIRNRNLLNEMELKWLYRIKDEELSTRYYNQKRKAWGIPPEKISERFKDHWADQEKKKKHKEGMKKAWTPERKAKYSEYMKAKWAQEDGYMQNRAAPTWTEERRELQREIISRNRKFTPEVCAKMSEAAKRRASTPEYKKAFADREIWRKRGS